jgi:hypothetical protein
MKLTKMVLNLDKLDKHFQEISSSLFLFNLIISFSKQQRATNNEPT